MAILLVGAVVGQSLEQLVEEDPKTIQSSFPRQQPTPPAVSSETLAKEVAKFPAVSVLDNVLYFQSWDHVKAVKAFLEAKAAEYGFQVYQKYGSRIPEADALALSPDQPYEDYEKTFPFTSLRQKVQREWLARLNAQPSAAAGSEAEADVHPEKSFQTLLNTFSEINVAKQFFRVSSQGAKSYATFQAMTDSRATIGTSPVDVLPQLLGPVSLCNSPAPLSAHRINASGRSGLWITLRHYYDHPDQTFKVQATAHHTYRPPGGLWVSVLGWTYARAYGRVSGLFWHVPTATIYRNLCRNFFSYNWGSPTSFDQSSPLANHIVTVNFRTRTGWTRANYNGTNPITGEHNSATAMI